MKVNLGTLTSVSLALPLAMVGLVCQGATIPVTGTWVVTNGDDTISPATANTNSPQLQPGATPLLVSGNTIQSGFPTINLANVGDFITARGRVNLMRTANLTNPNRLNTQLRIGLFDSALPPSTVNSAATSGYIAEYATGTPASSLREYNGVNANVFAGAGTTFISSAGADPEGDSFSGTPVSAHFLFTVTRIAGNQVQLSGRVRGLTLDDPLDNNYLQIFPITVDTPNAAFDFDFNRIGFLVGGNADASAGGLQNVRITSNLIVPEPASWLLAMAGIVAAGAVRRRTH